MRRLHLTSQQTYLTRIQLRPPHWSKIRRKVRRRNGGHQGRDVREGRAEGRDGCVVEIVALRDGLDLG